MPVVNAINLPVLMIKHFTGNLARYTKLGHLTPHRAADIMDGPAGDTGQLVKLGLNLAKVAARRNATCGAENEAVGFEAWSLAQLGEDSLSGG